MRRFVWTAATLAVVALMPGCNRKMKISHLPYPDTRRDTTVVDDYHGTRVADPYRWLEDDNSAETAAWVEAENAVTRDYLDRLPARQAIYDRLTALYDYPKEGAPERHGDYYYYFLNDGLQNQSALWRKRSLTAQGELFLDPNTLSADGTTALVDVSFSDDGRWCAYAAAEAGSDWVRIHVVDTATGQLTQDVIEWVKFSGATWAPDSEGFYYSAYDAPKANVIRRRTNARRSITTVWVRRRPTTFSYTAIRSIRCAISAAGRATTAAGFSSSRRKVRRAVKFSSARRTRRSRSVRCWPASPTTMRPSSAATTNSMS